jgi:hypothetical protein
MRKSKAPQHIKAESIHIGDVIRVSWQIADTRHSIVGKVIHRLTAGSSTYWTTADDETLLWRDNAMRVFDPSFTALAKITLLEAVADGNTTLEGIE